MRALGLVVPLLDEAPGCLADVRALAFTLAGVGPPFRILLVDNGSRDGTGALVEVLARTLPGVAAMHLRENLGYGGGILAGLAALDTPLVGWHWGDGQVAPRLVADAWRTLEEGAYDLVQARRVRREDGLLRAVQSRVYRRACRSLLGLASPDAHGCPKVLTREAFTALAPRATDWLVDLEVVWGAERAGMRVGAVDAVMARRRGGASKVRPGAALAFARALLRARRTGSLLPPACPAAPGDGWR